MGLGGEVNNQINAFIPHHGIDRVQIADIAVYEAEIRISVDRRKACSIAGISQGVEHHDPVIAVARQPEMSEVGSEKTSTSGDQ